MDKQQAAAQRYPYAPFNTAEQTDYLRQCFIAGWEARDSLSPQTNICHHEPYSKDPSICGLCGDKMPPSSPTDAVAPVFTKATDKLPPDDNDYFLWINMGDVYIRGVGHYEKEEDRFKDELSGFYYDLARVEWADLSDDGEETAPQTPAGPVWVNWHEQKPPEGWKGRINYDTEKFGTLGTTGAFDKYDGRDRIKHDEGGGTLISNTTAVRWLNESPAPAQQVFNREDMEKLLEWVRENDYNPRDKSDKPNWIQAGSKIGWLQPGMSIIKSSKQVLNEYMEKVLGSQQ